MASEATKMTLRGNMHIDTRVIEVPDFNSESNMKFGAIEPLRAPEGLWGPLKWLLWEESKVEHHKLISLCNCCPLIHRAIALCS